MLDSISLSGSLSQGDASALQTCMSSSDLSQQHFETLVGTLENIRREVVGLRAEITSIGNRVTRLETPSTPPSEFDLVSLPESAALDYTSAAALAGPASSHELPSDRAIIAREIGGWLRRALSEKPRGLSGRQQIRLASHYYLVVRGADKTVYDPVLIFTSWSEAKAICQIRGQLRDAVFVGLPSKEEVELAAVEGGFSLPADFGQL